MALAMAAVLLSGCGATGGQAMFFTGLFPRPTVKAEFTFGEGPVAVLVDDFQEICYWPEMTAVLADEVIRELGDRGVAKIVIPTAKVGRLRQADAEFDDRACTAVGRALEADELLVIEVRDFYATEDPVEASDAARLGVGLKVINAREREDRSKVRLWPREHEGSIVSAELSAADVRRAETREGIVAELAKALAEKIVRKFYDRPMDDFEKE